MIKKYLEKEQVWVDINYINEKDDDEWKYFDKNKVIATLFDIDGNVYRTIQIGEQEWMSENSRTTHYQNGDVIPNITNSEEWGRLSTGVYDNYVNDSININIRYVYLLFSKLC